VSVIEGCISALLSLCIAASVTTPTAAPDDPFAPETDTAAAVATDYLVPDMPDPMSPDWVAPPLPPKPPSIPVLDHRGSRGTPLGTDLAARAQEPSAGTEPSASGASSMPASQTRQLRNVLYAGIAITAAGALSGTFAYLAYQKAAKSEKELEAVSLPGVPPEMREGPIREIEKQNKITLATSVAAGVLGAVGLVLIAVGALHRSHRRSKNAIITRNAAWGFLVSF
jgi:hypothetical protein